MSTTILEIDRLSVSFDGFKAIDDLNFYVDENELHVVIGPNGAGKTTLLDMICGKTKPTTGTILFNGLNLERML
jgi:urea transport system ATP-binding protein